MQKVVNLTLSAPAESKSWTISTWPLLVAHIKGDKPLMSALSLLDPSYHSPLSGISCLLHELYSGILLDPSYHSPLYYI